MGKRLLSMLLAVCMVLSLASTALATDHSGSVSVNSLNKETPDTVAVGTTIDDGDSNKEFQVKLKAWKDTSAKYALETATSSQTVVDTDYKFELKNIYEINVDGATRYIGTPIANGKWIVEDANPNGYNNGYLVTLYPEIIGKVELKYNSLAIQADQTLTPVALPEDATYGISNQLQLYALKQDSTLDGTNVTTISNPALAGYEFIGWYTAPQGTEGAIKFADSLSTVNVANLYNLCTEQADKSLSVTLYAHYKHVHRWVYDGGTEGVGYLYCTGKDHFNECDYGLANTENHATAKLKVVISAQNTYYTGKKYDEDAKSAHRTATWYNGEEVINNLATVIDTNLTITEDPWVYTLKDGTATTTTNGASNTNKAPANIGDYKVAYTPFSGNAKVDSTVNTIVGVPFTISIGTQDAKVKMGTVDNVVGYKYGQYDSTYPNIGTTTLKDTTDANVAYYYIEKSKCANPETVSAAAIVAAGSEWINWKNVTPNTLPVGDYYLALYIPETESHNYAAYVNIVEFHVVGDELAANSVKAGFKSSDNYVTSVEYDGQEHALEFGLPEALNGKNAKIAFSTYSSALTDGRTPTYSAEYDSANPPKYTNVSDTERTGYVYYKVTADGYEPYYGEVQLTITPKKLYATAKANDKVYNGDTDATLTVTLHKESSSGDACETTATGSFKTGVGNEEITVSIPATFDDAHVNYNTENSEIDNRTVTPTKKNGAIVVNIDGVDDVDEDNYEIDTTGIEESYSAKITQKEVTLDWSATNKTYTVADYGYTLGKLPYNNAEYTVAATAVDTVGTDTISFTYVDGTVEGSQAGKTVVNHATAIGDYTAKVESLANGEYHDYKIKGSDSKNYGIGWVTDKTATVTGTQQNGWYNTKVTLTAPSGWKISLKTDGERTDASWTDSVDVETNGKLTPVEYVLKQNGTGALTRDESTRNMLEVKNLQIDTTKPVITDITSQVDSLKQKLSELTFGHLFTKTLNVTIVANDNNKNTVQAPNTVSGIVKYEYMYKTYDAATKTWTEKQSWTECTDGKFSIAPEETYQIYARVTDAAGNVSDTVYTDGAVLYTQSTNESTVEYTKLSTGNVESGIEIHKNTIQKVEITGVDGTTYGPVTLDALTSSNADTAGYTTKTESSKTTITLLAKKLNSLSAGKYDLVVTYYPNGVTYQADTVHEQPATSTIHLTVKKAPHVTENHDNLPAAPVVESVTTNTVTLKNVNNVDPKHNDTHDEDSTTFAYNETFDVEYSRDGGNTWQDSPVFTGLSSGTTYSFIARYKTTDNFLASDASDAVTATTTAVKRSSHSSGGSSATYYTVTVTAGAGGSADVGKVNVRSGRNKTINFTPNAGYVVADVVVNGKSVGACASYTLTNITKDTSVKVTFTQSANSVIVSTPTVINPSTGAGI